MLLPPVFTIICSIGLKMFFTYVLFSKYCIKVFFTGRFSVLCLAVRLSWVLLFVMLWAITGVLGCSVVLAYAVCVALGYNWGGWLFGCLGLCCLWCLVGLGWCLAVRLSWVVQFVGLGWAVGGLFGCRGLFNLWVCGLDAHISFPCSIGLALGWVWVCGGDDR